MKTACQDLTELLESQFEWLFRDRGAKLIHKEETEGGRCLAVLECGGFRIKVYLAPDEVNVLVGDLSAPLSWRDTDKEGLRVWHYLVGLAAYLEGDDGFADRALRGPSAEEATVLAQSHKLTKMLQEHISELERLFSHSGLKSEWAAYQQYLESVGKRVRTQYGRLKEDD